MSFIYYPKSDQLWVLGYKRVAVAWQRPDTLARGCAMFARAPVPQRRWWADGRLVERRVCNGKD